MEEIFGEQSVPPSKAAPELRDLSLSYSENELLFEGSFVCDDDTLSLKTSGALYKNEPTAHSGKAEDLVLHPARNYSISTAYFAICRVVVSQRRNHSASLLRLAG